VLLVLVRSTLGVPNLAAGCGAGNKGAGGGDGAAGAGGWCRCYWLCSTACCKKK
jgi:hypothetical protein